jgi:heterodisulfide reductase subunit A-like polyferredoxin
MEIKVVLCNCKGLCTSFKDADMNTLPFAVESELDVKYSLLNPQLCGQGGNAVLEDIFRTSTPDTYIISGACSPEAQFKLFKKIMRNTGFDEKHFIPVDIRGTNNEEIIERLRVAVETILKPENATAKSFAV